MINSIQAIIWKLKGGVEAANELKGLNLQNTISHNPGKTIRTST